MAESNKSGFLVGPSTSLADIYLLVLLDFEDMRSTKEYFVNTKKLSDVKANMLKAFPDVNSWITTMRPITDR